MKYPRVRLDSIKADMHYAFVGGPFGSNLTTRDYVDDGVPVIRGNNMSNTSIFYDDDFAFVSEEKAIKLTPNLAFPGDVVFTQRGTLGQVGVIPKNAKFDRYVISQSQMKLTVDPEKADAMYVYYYFRIPEVVQTVINLAQSSGVPHINLGTLKNFEIPLPPVDIQQRIISLLSTYDDLIENNRRRIDLLEQSARMLYKEWFVSLRFPGHEHVKVKNGVPEGWERKTLSELSDSIIYGYTASAETEPIGAKFLRITDIVPDVIDWDSVPYCRVSEEEIQKYLLRSGDIVVARTGATVGYAKRIGDLEHQVVFASYLVRFRFGNLIDDVLVGTFMESDEYKNFVRNNAGGAAQPNANAKILSATKILVPPTLLQTEYRRTVESLNKQKDLLQRQNQKLAQARGLLLPRLMNGEIPV